MGLLQQLKNTTAFAKIGIHGFQGGGKTKTATKIAIGLWHYLHRLGVPYADKPVAVFDTEKGSDFVVADFEAAGVPVIGAKRQSFADLLTFMDEAQQMASIGIIDSVTHPWRELMASYLKTKDRNYIQIDDWNYLKGDQGWKKFTDKFLNSPLHLIMCGRAGDEYATYVEDGRRKMEVVGTKMKAEGETGYEPDFSILMDTAEDMRTHKVIHRAIVQKDRSDTMDGAQIDNPDFKDFLPYIQKLAINGPHIGPQTDGNSRHLITIAKRDWQPVQREIVVDETQTLLMLHYPSQTAEDKKNKLKAMLECFDATWTEIEKVMPLPDLRIGYDKLHRKLEGKPSKYAHLIEAGRPADMNDALPDHSAPPTPIMRGTFEQIQVKPQQQQLAIDDALAPLGSSLTDEARAKIERHIDSLTVLDAG